MKVTLWREKHSTNPSATQLKKLTQQYCSKTLSQVKSGEIVTPSYLGQQVKVVRQRGEKGPRYLMTNCLTASNSKVRKRARLRWEVEVFFRRSKQHLGFGDYRVRRWQAIEKYILLVWIAYMIALSEPPPQAGIP